MGKTLRNATATIVFLALVSACGGGHDLRPDEGAARFYDAQFFRSTRLLALLTFEGELIYGFYQSDFTQPTFPEYTYAGFFVAKSASQRVGPAAYVGTEYNFDARQVSTIRVELATQSGENTFGTLVQVASSEDSAFTVRESANSRLPTNPALLPGIYAVQARSAGASFKATGAVDVDGNLSVVADACTVNAKLSPRQLGNVYDVVATFGPTCVLGAGAFSGHAIQAYVARNLYLLLTAPGGRGFMLLLSPNAA